MPSLYTFVQHIGVSGVNIRKSSAWHCIRKSSAWHCNCVQRHHGQHLIAVCSAVASQAVPSVMQKPGSILAHQGIVGAGETCAGLQHTVLECASSCASCMQQGSSTQACLLTGDRPGCCLQAVYQPQGGILASERCIAAHIHAARSHGAEFHSGEKVESWKVDPSSGIVTVYTDRGQSTAGKLVLTAGAWMSDIMPELQVTFLLLPTPPHLTPPHPTPPSYPIPCPSLDWLKLTPLTQA